MSLAKVRWRLADEEFEVLDHGRFWFGESDVIVASLEVVKKAGLTELNHALDRYRQTMYDGDYEIHLYDASEDGLRDEEDYLSPGSISLEFGAGHTFIVVEAAFEATFTVDQGEIASPALAAVEEAPGNADADQRVHQRLDESRPADLEISQRGRSVGDALRIGDDLERLWMAALGGHLSPATIHDLLLAQRSDLLVGQPESDWLECKGRPYRLREPLQRFELAKDIAMLANRPDGGVL